MFSQSFASVMICRRKVLVFVTLIGVALAAQSHVGSQSEVKQTPFPVCIDDSDCLKLGEGNKYACFQYICYPWKDDSHVAPKDRRRTCRTNVDCENDEQCMRHHDKRNVYKGVCFEEIQSCEDDVDCPKSYGCCAGTCCEMDYYKVFKALPCVSHLGCQDLGLGQFCCPSKTNSTQNVCCNTDPNPPTTPYPMPASALGSAQRSNSLTALFAVTVFVILRQLSLAN